MNGANESEVVVFYLGAVKDGVRLAEHYVSAQNGVILQAEIYELAGRIQRLINSKYISYEIKTQ